MEWKLISSVPFDRDLELAIIEDHSTIHAISFPCRRILGGWMDAGTKYQIDVDPSHWREWDHHTR